MAKKKTTKKQTGTAKRGRKSNAEKQAELAALQKKRDSSRRVKNIISGLVYIAIGAFIFVAVNTGAAGEIGNTVGNGLKGIFGHIALVLPWYLVVLGVLMVTQKAMHFSKKTLIITIVILLLLCIMNSGRFIEPGRTAIDIRSFYADGVMLMGGGVFGMTLGTALVRLIGLAGLYIFSTAALVICLFLLLNTPFSRWFEKRSEKRAERRLMKELEAEEEPYDDGYEVIPEEKGLDAYGDRKETPAVEKKRNTAADRSISSRDTADLSAYKPTPLPSTTFTNFDIFGNEKTGGPETGILNEYGSSAASDPIDLDNGPEPVIAASEDDFFSQFSGISGGSAKAPVQTAPSSVSEVSGASGTEPVISIFDEEIPSNTDRDGLTGMLEDAEKEDPFGGHLIPNPYDAEESAPPADTDDFEMPQNSQPEDPDAGKSLDDIPPLSMPEKTTHLDKDAAAAAVAGAAVGLAVGTSGAGQNRPKPKPYVKPDVSLLNRPKDQGRGSANALRERAALLENTLRTFNVDAKVTQVTQGPTVTRFEIQPNVGVKVSKIVNLQDDIALNLKAKSIRIEAPIPGKAAIGIEVENEKTSMVCIREVLDTHEFTSAKSKISFAVGKDIAGNVIVADLKKMPHLLIAGSTGSGKSVCINTIITSILYKADPNEVKLILVDPKVVELGNYNGIPHLLIPVVTDPSKAAAALNWAVAEMTNRYKIFAENNVRDLESYNRKVNRERRKDLSLPQIVIIIDELADLMMVAKQQVESSIIRLGQLARAAGMHLIVATQRPSVNVVTGLIKANIPSRIAFAVSSQIDSRTILDEAGAEKLIGKGDMLYAPLGIGKPLRVQGPFVSDEETARVLEFIKSQDTGEEYNAEVADSIESGINLGSGGSGDADELLPEAIECAVHEGKASTSMLQRRFRIGYNRAARIMDEMEERGIIGPQDGARPREVKITQEEFEEMKASL